MDAEPRWQRAQPPCVSKHGMVTRRIADDASNDSSTKNETLLERVPGENSIEYLCALATCR